MFRHYFKLDVFNAVLHSSITLIEHTLLTKHSNRTINLANNEMLLMVGDCTVQGLVITNI